MNQNIPWFIGITLGDGSLSGRMVRVWNNEKTITDRWTKILNKNFGIPKEKIKTRRLKKDRNGFKRNKETLEVTVNSLEFKRKIKRLTQELISSNDLESDKIVLQGIFDAEGSINGRCEVVIWQRKNEQGNMVTKFIKEKLQQLDIKFRDQSNNEFHIIFILGGLKNKDNFVNFSQLINFSHPKKKEWLDLDLEILSLNRKITEEEIVEFLQHVESVTVNDLVRHFKVIERLCSIFV